MMKKFAKKLQQLREAGRYRSLQLPCGVDLSSNDYLGLSAHPALRTAAIEALEGGIVLGSGGSRLLRGHRQAHEALEEFAAEYYGCGKALFFSSGFQANSAIFTSLPERHDTVIFDALIHASAREAIQASGVKRIRAAHNNLESFEDGLKKAGGQKWIAVESVYSMDGDLAPLTELLELAAEYDAYLIVDEAHGTGVFGESGKGLSEGMAHERIISLHTCGKALGVAGGLVCGRAEIIDYMINKARAFIYSTAPMPLQAVVVKKALEIVQGEPERRERLFDLIAHANKVLPAPDSPSQIIPVVLGEDARAMEVAAAMQEAGFDIRAIRPPTVPEGTARLRLSLNVGITKEDLERFVARLGPYLQEKAA